MIRVHGTPRAALKLPCTLYHALMEEASDPARFPGSHGAAIVRQLHGAKAVTPAAWMVVDESEESDGGSGWMHAIAAQVDYHTARWSSAGGTTRGGIRG